MAGIFPFKFMYRRNSSGTFKETYHAHAEMEFLYVHQGYGTLILNQQTYDISPGFFIVFQPFQLHRVQMTDTADSPFIRSVVLFDPALVEEQLRTDPKLHPFFRHLCQDRLPIQHVVLPEGDGLPQLLQAFQRLETAADDGNAVENGIAFMAFFLRYLLPEWKKGEKILPARPLRSPQKIEQILGWLEQHFREPFRLSSLSEQLFMSPYRISHLFKEMTGTSITAYLTSRRIREACLLLQSTQLSVRDVGERVGITNCSHFCHIFKRTTGVSPHQFRSVERKQQQSGK